MPDRATGPAPPGAFSDGVSVYLVYRVRWPRPRRGGELRVARGDGERFETIWRATREDFGSPSIERCAILRDGRTWRLYVSYVDGIDGRWRIDVIEAGSPDSFDPAARRLALDSDMANAVAVKDPWLRKVGDRWWMFVSYGERPPGDEWIGLYDGASDISENYEERCGLARSTDLRAWKRIGSGPAIGAAGGPGTIRYVESVVIVDSVRFFFERTRADGSHELCTSATPLSEWDRDSPG